MGNVLGIVMSKFKILCVERIGCVWLLFYLEKRYRGDEGGDMQRKENTILRNAGSIQSQNSGITKDNIKQRLNLVLGL